MSHLLSFAKGSQEFLKYGQEAFQKQRPKHDQARRDLHDTLSRECGIRVFDRLLRDLGAGGLMTTEDDMRMRNIAEQLLQQAAQAHPEAAARIICGLYGIGSGVATLPPTNTNPQEDENE